MITKPADQHTSLPKNPQLRAGVEAERQMAFYLHRAFAADPDLHVLNDIRLVDPDQPDPGGKPGVCQIDHLVLSRRSAFIIESKSVTDEVTVQSDGAGGDEWTRRTRGREQGFPSPIQQARRQADFLRTYLNNRSKLLLGKMPAAALARVLFGSDQRGFRHMPIQIAVAISDSGKIVRRNDWTPPQTPLPTIVSKADLVPEQIAAELAKHRKADNSITLSVKGYGFWNMKPDELPIVAQFLADHHTPRNASPPRSPQPPPASAQADPPTSPSSPPTPASQPIAASTSPQPATQPEKPGIHKPTCKNCAGTNLTARHGRFGYFWHCAACETNTAMPRTCSACGKDGKRDKSVRIRKQASDYFRTCTACGREERIWTAPAPA